MAQREFQFREGGSDKFWAIDVAGKAFTVRFGRTGTAGQAQTKEFGSLAEAQQAADKLIAEKTRKGYVEVSGGSAVPVGAAAPAPKVKAKAAPAPAPAAPAAVAPSPPSTPSAPSALTGTRAIDLDPVDWYMATWRRLDPLPPLPSKQTQPPLTAAELKEQVKGWFDPRGTAYNAIFLRCPAADVLDLFANDDKAEANWLVQTNYAIPRYWIKEVVSRLDAAQRESLRKLLRKRLKSLTWPLGSHYQPPEAAFFLAARLGLHDEMLALVSSWPDDAYVGKDWDHTHYHMPQWIVFGLGSPDLVNTHMRRLRLPLRSPDYFRAWLAHTEYSQLDYLAENILAEKNKDHVDPLVETLCLVKAPEAAGPMLEVKLGAKVTKHALNWLITQTGHAIAGLLPVAAGRGQLAEAAVDFLRAAKKQGHGALIEQQVKQAPAEVAERIRTLVLEHAEKTYEPLTAPPPWLARALSTPVTASSPVPAWVEAHDLPPIVVDGKRLTENHVAQVLNDLRFSTLTAPPPLLKALKANGDRASLDAFVWRIFERWMTAGAPSKEKWGLLALGQIGGDAVALKLAPLVRAWPGESQHPRAVLGLECLRAMGSDGALMVLNGIAQKLKFKGLQNKAREMMDAIAADRGFTRDQLEDRIVPDLDLDARGRREFDFGPRRFALAIGNDLKPQIRDDAGKVRDDLPKPSAKDEAEKAAAAVEEWKLLKKQLRDALKVQSFRLEQAMVTGRRWTPTEFETLLLRHPLLIHLVRRLLWGGFDAGGKLVRTFRVTEEQECVDVDDRPASLDGLAVIGIVHPLQLSEEQRTRWGQVFGDYEILPPFPQLGRATYRPEKAEADATSITRFAKVKVPGVSVASLLEGNGWQRGRLEDHGDFHDFTKQFPAANQTAIVEVEPGLWASNIGDLTEQSLPNCAFVSGLERPFWWWLHQREKQKMLPMKKVDAVVFSEVLADLHALAAKSTV
jgi:predicted DNA-binding WGR domain protein